MQTTILESKEAPCKWWAAVDAAQRNLTNKSHYTSEVQLKVERMKLVVDMVYHADGIFECYGKKGVSVKIDNAVVKDEILLKSLEQDWEQAGFTKKITKQGVVYRLLN